MKKAFLHITLAAVMSWGVIIVVNLLLRAVLSYVEAMHIRNLIAAVYFTVGFCLCMLYVEQIRNGRGEDLFSADYENGSYNGFGGDLKVIWKHERSTLYTYWLIVAVCFAVNAVYTEVLGNARVFFLTAVYATPLSWSSVFPESFGFAGEAIGYLLSAAIVPACYLLTLLIYRRMVDKGFKKARRDRLT